LSERAFFPFLELPVSDEFPRWRTEIEPPGKHNVGRTFESLDIDTPSVHLDRIVFEPAKLTTLAHVEFLQEKQHLPAIGIVSCEYGDRTWTVVEQRWRKIVLVALQSI